ncbi:MAG: PAS domain S-box protein [Chloroflexi bacterium]|nr:PAS domain S-box protein [Chloroflexota bacterium]MDA1147295.1 PAS domain S-box protein [Chloroflexota bacterium]
MRLPDHLDQHHVLELMVDHARNAILLIGTGRRSLYVNRAFLDLTGYSYDEWMDLKHSWSLTPERDQAETGKRLNAAIQNGSTDFRLRPVVRKDGSEVWAEGCMTRLPIAGEGLLFAEFRPPPMDPPDGGIAWIPTAP